MWFKQVQIFQLSNSLQLSPQGLTEKLEKYSFQPCLPSHSIGLGWAPLLDEEGAPMVRYINDCFMFCLQIEEKILPAAVIRQELNERIKKLEASENRKVRQKEKSRMKDDILITLLPRSFSKFSRIYAYIDTKNNWLILGNLSSSKTEQFMTMFKKTVTEDVKTFELKKLSFIMAHWIKEKSYPRSLAIEKACVLQDPEQQNRIIRCQQQDLFANSILSLLKDGCEVKQLALVWNDQMKFVLADDFSLRSIQFQEDVKEQIQELEPETKQQILDANFMMMSSALARLLKELLEMFVKKNNNVVIARSLAEA